jgi:hypothetical protein
MKGTRYHYLFGTPQQQQPPGPRRLREIRAQAMLAAELEDPVPNFLIPD